MVILNVELHMSLYKTLTLHQIGLCIPDCSTYKESTRGPLRPIYYQLYRVLLLETIIAHR
jgi:hypothetical protein